MNYRKIYAVYEVSEKQEPVDIFTDKNKAEVYVQKFPRGFVRELARIEAIAVVIQLWD